MTESASLILPPKEIWITSLLPLLEKQDLMNLRLTNRAFHVSCYWRQWVPFEYLKSYLLNLEKFQWKVNIYGIYFYMSDVLLLRPSIFHFIPSTIEEIDLISFKKLSFSDIPKIPPFIKRIFLPYSFNEFSSLNQFRTDLEISFERNMTLLFRCCYSRFSIEDALNNKIELKNINKQCGSDGCTSLFIACQNCSSQVVKVLLENGADPNIPRRKDGFTSLMLCCFFEKLDTLTVLLKVPTLDLEAKNISNLTALDYAQKTNALVIINLLTLALSEKKSWKKHEYKK